MEKVQFVICATDELELQECEFYLERITVPEQMEVVLTVIWDAKSMTEGYNRAMKMVDAKYRVYLHQDTMVMNQNLIFDMRKVFEQDIKLGMMGVIGCKEIPLHAVCHSAWDTGRVEINQPPFELPYEKQNAKGNEQSKEYEQVEAVDGLIIMTQYDIPWREDLFSKWDYYDISQAMEFKRKGYKVAVPFQKKAWCWHDNETSKLANYSAERTIFAMEYQDQKPFEKEWTASYNPELEQTLLIFEQEMLELAEHGQIDEVGKILEQYRQMIASHTILILLDNIGMIRKQEAQSGEIEKRYADKLSAMEMLRKIRQDKWKLKRVEHQVLQMEQAFLKDLTTKEISTTAVLTLTSIYVKEKQEIIKYLQENNRRI